MKVAHCCRTCVAGVAWHAMAWSKPSSSLMLRLVVHAINRIGRYILPVCRNAPSLRLNAAVSGGWNGIGVLALALAYAVDFKWTAVEK